MINLMILKDEIIRLRTEKGWEQIDLARRTGIKQQTLSLIEKGDTKSSKFIGVIAEVLGVPVSKIDTSFAGFAPDSPVRHKNADMLQGGIERNFPIYAAAEGGDGAIILSWDAIEYTATPPGLEFVRGGYGMYIVGESMEPRYDRGEKVWVNPNVPARPGQDVLIFQSSDGETKALVKRLVKMTPTELVVSQYNPAKTFRLPRTLWSHCHVITGKANQGF